MDFAFFRWKKIIKNTVVVSQDPKTRFRELCLHKLNRLRSITLPSIRKESWKEAVLIEYRKLPHLNFLIRNTIVKLGSSWSHTIICGTLNYTYMVQMCKSISPEINVIQTPYDNLNQSTYSLMLASLDFWNLLHGEKILIYQEDSCIFKSNMNDFLHWDYIGAPWPRFYDIAPISVGNGGFSLRTRQCMMDVIQKISIQDTQVTNAITKQYMTYAGITVCPEDVYFSKNMQQYGIGQVADEESALLFSTENVLGNDSLGGHNFWLSDPTWENRVTNMNYSNDTPNKYMKIPNSFVVIGTADDCKEVVVKFAKILHPFHLILAVYPEDMPSMRSFVNSKIQIVLRTEKEEWLKKSMHCISNENINGSDFDCIVVHLRDLERLVK